MFSLFQIYILCFQEAAMTSGGLGVQGLDKCDFIQAFFFPNHPTCFLKVSKTFQNTSNRFQNESNIIFLFLEHIQNFFPKVSNICLIYSHLPLGGLTSLQCLQWAERRSDTFQLPQFILQVWCLPYSYIPTLTTPVLRLWRLHGWGSFLKASALQALSWGVCCPS